MLQKRLTKRQIREDPLVVWMARAEWFVSRHLRRLLVAAGGVVVAIAIVFAWQRARQGAELAASELLAQAEYQLWTGNQVEAAALARQVIERSAGTRSGLVAQIVLGDALLATGNAEGALAAYRSFLQRGRRDPVLGLSARRGEAAALEHPGQAAAAAAAYEELARKPIHEGTVPGDQLAAARCYERAGEIERARQLYREILDAHRSEPVGSDALLRLAELEGRGP